MADERDGKTNFLHRWSQRKLAAARDVEAKAATPASPPSPPPPAAPGVAAPPAAAAAAESQQPALPDVATLTFESDFKAFLAPEVDEGTRRAALRKLFSDPRFNVQDGLDVYIDDYSKFEPLPADLAAKLAHARYLFDPPKTRVNEHGHVEDVVEEVAAPKPAAAPSAADAPAAAPPAGDPLPAADATVARVEESNATPDALPVSRATAHETRDAKPSTPQPSQ